LDGSILSKAHKICYFAYLERGQHRFAMNDEMNTDFIQLK
jgi:hypothetical protein